MNWITSRIKEKSSQGFSRCLTLFSNIGNNINIINKYIVFWPGGKPKSDTIINNVGDTFGAVLGWLSAYYLDKLGYNYKWYALHIN